MAPGSGASNATPQQIPKSSNMPAPPPQDAPSPPSRRDLTSWWKQFKGKTKKDEATGPQPSGIFGVPLNVSIKYANVAISLTGDDGQRFVYGYVPIVVAKCGVFLKEKATEAEGIFRLSGSAKRINALQEVFDSPDRFGKGLDWTGYTVHDAANIFRRYLNQLPEPIVPLEFYERFREPLRQYRAQHAQTSGEEETSAEKPPFNSAETVAGYQQLIKELPPLNRQLLLYILDLLTVFAAKADVNRMTAANLSAIFQPGLLSHPDHHMSPDDYKLSQDVLVFLIENQDSFLFGMAGTAADEQTVKDVEAGYSPQIGKSGLQRSASNASAGADSLRKYEAALRRNASASSKHSKASASNTGSPTGMVHRSNTVPSKRPSGLSPKIQQGRDDPSSPSEGLSPRKSLQHSRSPSQTPSRTASPLVPHGVSQSTAASAPADSNPATSEAPVQPENTTSPVEEMEVPSFTPNDTPKGAMTPTKERKLSSLFAFASSPDDGRQKPNRLKKKRRVPESTSASAQSSTHSLHTATESTSQIPPASQSDPAGGDQSYLSTPKASDTVPDQSSKDESSQLAAPETNVSSSETQGEAAKKQRSRPSSAKSRSSATDVSDADRLDDPSKGENKEKRRSWRFHRPRHSRDPTPVGMFSNSRADASHSSIGSPSMSQENVTGGQQGSNANLPSTTGSTLVSQDSNLSSVGQASVASSKDNNNGSSNNNQNNNNNNGEGEKKGFFDKFRAKVAQVKDRDGDKSRAKSPPSHSEGEKAPRNSHSLFSSRDSKSNRDTSSDNSNSNNPPTADNPQPTNNQEQRQPAAAAAAAAPPTTTSPSSTPAPVPSSAIPDAPVTTEDGKVIEKTASGNPAASGEPETGPVTPLKTVDENAPLSLVPTAEENVPATTDTSTATTTKTDTSATPAETTTETAPGPTDASVPENPAVSATEPAVPAQVTEEPVLESVNETSKPPAAAP